MRNLQRIAVIGSGISGLTAAYTLSPKYHVDLYESSERIGGHTHTITVQDDLKNNISIDTGFIVFNKKNYPNFIRILDQLSIDSCDSDMSFSFWDSNSNFYYGSDFPKGVFAKKAHWFSFEFYRFLFEIYQFNALCKKEWAENKLSALSLGAFLKRHCFSNAFIARYVVPMTAAIWSASFTDAMAFPMETFVRFWTNHNLLQFFDRLPWKTIPGGANRYVQAILHTISGSVFTNSPVLSLQRRTHNIQLSTKDTCREYDGVVVATHANQALNLLQSPLEDESRLLGAWSYSKNSILVHTDPQFMPPNKDAWCSWNVTTLPSQNHDTPVCLTYWMNRLQPLPTSTHFFVTLNPPSSLPVKNILQTGVKHHPIMNRDAIQTQSELPKLNQASRIVFCGSYFNYGFHEDGVSSSLSACAELEKTLGG